MREIRTVKRIEGDRDFWSWLGGYIDTGGGIRTTKNKSFILLKCETEGLVSRIIERVGKGTKRKDNVGFHYYLGRKQELLSLFKKISKTLRTHFGLARVNLAVELQRGYAGAESEAEGFNKYSWLGGVLDRGGKIEKYGDRVCGLVITAKGRKGETIRIVERFFPGLGEEGLVYGSNGSFNVLKIGGERELSMVLDIWMKNTMYSDEEIQERCFFEEKEFWQR